MDTDLLTKEQVAEMLLCEVFTVEEKTRSGELPAVKIGRQWVYPREALMLRLNEMALANPATKQRVNRAAARKERARLEMEQRRRPTPISIVSA